MQHLPASSEHSRSPSEAPGGGAFSVWRKPDIMASAPRFDLDEVSPSVLVVGETREVLDAFPNDSFQACVTSPPYWHVRDYGVEGQLGVQARLDDYVYSLVETFSRVHRVTRSDGLLWVNIGDGYTSGGRTWRAPDKKNPNRAMARRPPTPDGLKKKDLLGVPWRLAFALQQPWYRCDGCGDIEHAMRWGQMPDRQPICPACQKATARTVARPGWYLRSELIWYRPNCQPESVKDRMTRSHEHIFMLSKSEHYRYDSQARRGPNNRNLRTVLCVNTDPGRHGHIAPFPEALVDPLIAVSTRRGDVVLDPFLGSGTTALVAQRLGRRFVGIELKAEYAELAEGRIRETLTSGPSGVQTAQR